MRRLIRTAAVLTVLVFPVIAAPVPKRKPAEADLLVGWWHDESAGKNGYWHLKEGGEAEVGERGQPMVPTLYRVDTAAEPKQFDWSWDGGRSWFLGVYERDGDTLRVVAGVGGSGQRPASLEGQPNCTTLKRVKD